MDGFHLEAIHGNYMQTVMNRTKIMMEKDAVKTMDIQGMDKLPGGYYDLGNGHVMLWNKLPGVQNRPLYEKRDELTDKHGEVRTSWMIDYIRNLLIYPNVFLMDQMSTQIRVFRPIAVDKTEVTTYCMAPIGESAEARRKRIRQYEDFFNASGMATPDDLAAFSMSQVGFNGSSARWSDMSRGATNIVNGPEPLAKELGLNPVTSGTQLEDEGLMIAQHRRWLELMESRS